MLAADAFVLNTESFAEVLTSAMEAWPARARGGGPVSPERWCALMADGACWIDEGFLIAAAELFRVHIVITCVDAGGAPRAGCCDGVLPAAAAPVAVVRLGLLWGQHYVALAQVAGAEPRAAQAKLRAGLPPSDAAGGVQPVGWLECTHGAAPIFAAGTLGGFEHEVCLRAKCLEEAAAFHANAAVLAPGSALAETRARPKRARFAADDDLVQVAPQPAGGGAGALAPAAFCYPLTTRSEVQRLLASDGAPTVLVGMEFSGAMRDALIARGVVAISADLRACDAGGMHFQGDVREIVGLQRWARIYFFPPCFQQLRADEYCLPRKLEDGRAFWGCAMVLWCLACPHSAEVVVEQPDTIVYDEYRPPGVTIRALRTSQFGDESDKFVRLALRGVQAPPKPPGGSHSAEASQGSRSLPEKRPLECEGQRRVQPPGRARKRGAHAEKRDRRQRRTRSRP